MSDNYSKSRATKRGGRHRITITDLDKTHRYPCGCEAYDDRMTAPTITYCATHGAAPDLVAVLENLPTIRTSGRDYGAWSEWVERADAALAKARVEQRLDKMGAS